ncbi:MAG: HEAT repeat domain-containing protein [Candidatus Hydrogenedentales bacterium]
MSARTKSVKAGWCALLVGCILAVPGLTETARTEVSMPETRSLSEAEISGVRLQIERIDSHFRAAGIADLYKEKGIPVSEYLVQVVQDSEEPRAFRNSALFWLGLTKDDSAIPVLFSMIDAPLPDPISDGELNTIRCAILALGFNGSPRALERVFGMMTPAYWSARGGVPECPEKGDSREKSESWLRDAAVSALAESGSEEAIQAFATGERIPKDKLEAADLYLSEAIFINCGIHTMPDSLDKLEPEARKRYEATRAEVISKYGSMDEIRARIKSIAESGSKTE